MNPTPAWHPTAGTDALAQRAAMLRAAREFFAVREVLEVETPVLGCYGVTDRHIQSMRLTEAAGWLRTSPEYHMKRLLAAGSGDIYQIGKVFRAAETGARHQPEFTMAEWYRLGFSLADMIQETCEFIRQLHKAMGFHLPGDTQIHSYSELVLTHTGIDPLHATTLQLKQFAMTLPDWSVTLEQQLGDDHGAWLDFIVSSAVYPLLSTGTLQVVIDHPADQAMLARIRKDNPQIAERFEVFLNGLELANGFHELDDADEQRQRFAMDNKKRVAAGLPVMAADDLLLAALDDGLPDCCGVAVGLDRIMMLAGGYDELSSTMSFRPGS